MSRSTGHEDVQDASCEVSEIQLSEPRHQLLQELGWSGEGPSQDEEVKDPATNSSRRRRRRKKKGSAVNPLRTLGHWNRNLLSMKAGTKYPPNLFLHYDQTLTPQKYPEDLAPMKIYDLQKLRRGAEAHRQVRRYAQGLMRPGVSMMEVCTQLEAKTMELLGNNLEAGIGFPTGLSLNECAAHDSAIPGDTRVIGENDVCKVDFGTHVDGLILDSAFTVAFNPRYDPLLEASKEGTWAGIKMAGPDVLFNEMSQEIQEVIESYEVELDGKVYPVKAIGNLGGHNILPYRIHGGDLILGAPSEYSNGARMQSNMLYAIETFASTGSGSIVNNYEMETSHYMRPTDAPRVPLKLQVSKNLLGRIMCTRSSLPFCTRWLEQEMGTKYRAGLSDLTKKGILQSYPPLCDIPGSYTSQLEHTILVTEKGKEVLTYGDDY